MFNRERAQFKPKIFVPEIMQISNMDCGPAVLKSIAEGYGVHLNYNRLREVCETDVDGTSIDVLHTIAVQLKLDAEQMIVPKDHLLLSEAEVLPAIVVTKRPEGEAHFVVVWNVTNRFVQIMDPAYGRRWVDKSQLFEEVYEHQHLVAADAWRSWAGSEGFLDPLQARLSSLKLEQEEIEQLLIDALEDLSWWKLALLDSSVRMVEGMKDAADLTAFDSYALIRRFIQQEKSERTFSLIPRSYWSVFPEGVNEEGREQLFFKGVILIRVAGVNEEVDEEALKEFESKNLVTKATIAKLDEPDVRAEQAIFKLLKEDGYLAPSVLLLIISLSVFGLMVEALLFRGLLEAGKQLVTVQQRTELFVAILLFFLLMMLLEIPLNFIMLKLGQRLETRLRIRFLEKLPNLGEQYFRTRLKSDLIQRMHEMRLLRILPQTAVSFIRVMIQIILTVFVIILMNPTRIFINLLAAVSAVGLAFLFQPFLIEHDLRFRTHTSLLSRFYLDALLGIMPIRTHNAQQTMRREHESLLTSWTDTGLKFYNLDTQLHLIQSVVGVIFAVWIIVSYVIDRGQGSGILLLFYWTLNLPVLGQSLATYAEQYPTLRNRIVRLLEPLDIPEEVESYNKDRPVGDLSDFPTGDGGLGIELVNVSLDLGGTALLKEINLKINPGEHIGIVGRSGAGKSTLMQLLLAVFAPTKGTILFDNVALVGEHLESLRRQIAWVDSDVLLWNETLLYNLQYGSYDLEPSQLGNLLEDADLFSILEQLPNGLQTALGDGGRLISAGEGQRVRIGRALGRTQSRLFILDEPFRGVEDEVRQRLLKSMKSAASDATLLLITHKVQDVLGLPRVLVIENGMIVEDGIPSELIKDEDSHYFRLVQSEKGVGSFLQKQGKWEKWFLKNQQLEISPITDEK